MNDVSRANCGITRRRFLAASAAGALLAPGVALGQDASPRSRIVRVRSDKATDEEGVGAPETVREMVHRAIRELTGKEALGEAYATFVKPEDVVGIKVNVRAGTHLSVQPCVIQALCEGLTAAGVAENNIIVFDAWTEELPTAGYTVNVSDKGVRFFGADYEVSNLPPGERHEAIKPYYAAEPSVLGDKQTFLTRIVTERVTALVNVPMIKDHVIVGATCALKNYYGCTLNPSDLHANRCDPYIAQLNALPAIRDKTRLVLVDALRALYNGGPHDKPQWRWRENCIVAGTDPVAIDSEALRVIERKRAEAGMDSIAGWATYIGSAAKLGLGTDDPARIDLREIAI